MAFEIKAHGTRAGVIKEIQAAKSRDRGEQDTQLEAAKEFLIKEVAQLPEKFNGAEVTAVGQFHDGGRVLQITIIPRQLAL